MFLAVFKGYILQDLGRNVMKDDKTCEFSVVGLLIFLFPLLVQTIFLPRLILAFVKIFEKLQLAMYLCTSLPMHMSSICSFEHVQIMGSRDYFKTILQFSM